MFSFGWGNSVAVREALLLKNGPWFSSLKELEAMDYPPNEGLPELIALTKKLTKEHYFGDFKYVAVTGGAHHAIATILRAFRSEFISASIGKTHFSFYPRLIEKENYTIFTDNVVGKKILNIIDSPSNPKGFLTTYDSILSDNILWDAVYNNGIFNKLPGINPGNNSRFFVGSFSKFTGLNGIRLGWIGCNSLEDFNKIHTEIVNDTLGISVPSQNLMIDILKDVDIDDFVLRAAAKIDNNRGEMLKLEKFLQVPVPVNGMFYLGKMDKDATSLFKKAGVDYIEGSTCGAPGYGRLNLAQNNNYTKEMVKAVLLSDTVK